MRRNAPLLLFLAASTVAASLTACGELRGSDPDTVKVAFLRDTDNKVRVRDNYIEAVKKDFEAEYPGKKVKMVPIQATPNDYYAKIQQMMRAPRTAPDLVYEDTFLISSDIEAGYLRPLDKHLKNWSDWDQFEDSAKDAAKGQDGRTYGVPDGTDTRGLWFNRKLFEKAGLPTDWKPRTWDDVLKAARTLKKKVPGVVPLNVFTGKGAGEAAVMQGFEMLLYGTGKDPLYDPDTKKWISGSRGFRDVLEFYDTVYREKLGPEVSEALDANIQSRVATELLPEQKLAIDLDGSWLGQHWLKSGGETPWPEWSTTLKQAPMPTQDGSAPGKVSLSGGWTWAVPRKAPNPDLAWKMIETFQSKRNAVKWCVQGAQIAVRKDVAEDPRYLRSMPGIDFFTDLVRHTHYRPALPAYPRVSGAIGEAMEKVTTKQASPEKAAREYDRELRSITDGAVVRK
ncbi:extracellular solute-binding protein [Streptomyces sp. NPDC005438]|uniref:extracellular solute-binding protein n=1 Tax=Streptomyces sp. NPDC005438 TaxID=3156880 RepID=UPI0033A9EE77